MADAPTAFRDVRSDAGTIPGGTPKSQSSLAINVLCMPGGTGKNNAPEAHRAISNAVSSRLMKIWR